MDTSNTRKGSDTLWIITALVLLAVIVGGYMIYAAMAESEPEQNSIELSAPTPAMESGSLDARVDMTPPTSSGEYEGIGEPPL